MEKKLKIIKVPPRVVELEEEKARCGACSGSGRYDSWDTKRAQPIPCGACKGAGKSSA